MCRLPTIVDKMKNRLSPFQNVNTDMTQYTADVALIIVTTESYSWCENGLGRVGGAAVDIFQSSQPLAMTTDTYALGDLTAVHELGHVLGGNHEIESPHSIAPGTNSDARGYVSTSDSWQTIMGGYYGCPFVYLPSQPSCVRLSRWSNPLISYSGESTGVSGVSNMASGIDSTAPVVADWTSYPTATPTSAPTLTVVPEYCFGSNSLAWTTVSSATHYQLFSSGTGAFIGSERIYIGSNTGLFVNIAYNSTEYFRVRACNGNGCGPYSSIKSASYYNGCI